MKKLFSLLAIVLSSTGIFAHDFAVDGIYYNLLGGDSVAVTYNGSGSKYPGSVTIPETVVYNSTTYRVTTIGSYAFSGSSLTSITIPNSVTTIGEGAFSYCSSLTSITIPNSVTTIGYSAFTDCSGLTQTNYTGDLASWCKIQFGGWGANPITYSHNLYINGTSITKADIPEGVTSISQYAFYGLTPLAEVTIPNSVTTIGSSAFGDCSSLTAITWNAKNYKDFSYPHNAPFYDISSQITFFTFGNKVEHIPAHLCYGMSNLTSITIPNSVTTIGSSAFGDCSSLTQTNYTGDLASWCKIRFEEWYSNPTRYSHNLYINGQSLTKADVPEGVTAISQYAFCGLTSLTEVSIPNSVTSIGSYAFSHCSNLTTVTIGTGLDSLAVYAFCGCNKLTKFICYSTHAVGAMEYEGDKSDEYIAGAAQEGAFLLCNKQLDTIVAPAQFFDLTEPAWSSLTKSAKYIQINGGEITTDAFGVINRSFDKLQTLDISAATNTEIANNAFKGCYKLETLLLPSQLERIGYMAVADCKNLQAIDIPATVTDIDDSAFENCRSIQTLTFGGQQPANAPHSKVETPFMASPQVAQAFALQRIGNWAFYNCHELQHLEIPEGVTEIGAAAFYGCTYLEDLTLPTSVQSIGDNCFALCSKLNKITCLATTPPTIEAKTFYDVKRSIPLYVPETSINDYANDTYWGEFINTQAAENTTGVETNFMCVSDEVRKVLENGVLYILRGSEKYTIDGRKVE